MKILPAIFFILHFLPLPLPAEDLHSPYAPLFFALPTWLPNAVSATYTPGSDSMVGVYTATNPAAGCNEIVTNLLHHRLEPEVQSSAIHTLDGWCERDWLAAAYQDSRDWWTGVDLRTEPLPYSVGPRANLTRRVGGKTNLWNVAERIYHVANDCHWHAGFPGVWVSAQWDERNRRGWFMEEPAVTEDVFDSGPWWSSQAFYAPYGEQLPPDLDWTDSPAELLDTLKNKCAVMRGFPTNSPYYAGTGTNGFCLTEMYPEEFDFEHPDEIPHPTEVPGHAFGLEYLASNRFEYPFLDKLPVAPRRGHTATNRSLRTESQTQAAVNQAMSMMDRTIHFPYELSADTGVATTYTRVRGFGSDYVSFYDLGLVEDVSSGYPRWRANSGLQFWPTERTNYWTEATNEWSGGSYLDDDCIEITSNRVSATVKPTVVAGDVSFSADEVAGALNDQGFAGSDGAFAVLYAKEVVVSGSFAQLRLGAVTWWGCDEPSAALDFLAFPTNTHICVSGEVRNRYCLRESPRPCFSSWHKWMPVERAWGAASHARASSCHDVCTAALAVEIGEEDAESARRGTLEDWRCHCEVLSRGPASVFCNVHSNEWVAHHRKLRECLEEPAEIDFDHPRNRVGFTSGAYAAFLGTIVVPRDTYSCDWTANGEQVSLSWDSENGWRADWSEESVGATCTTNLRFESDSDELAIDAKPAAVGRVRSRITTIVDWNPASIRRVAQ